MARKTKVEPQKEAAVEKTSVKDNRAEVLQKQVLQLKNDVKLLKEQLNSSQEDVLKLGKENLKLREHNQDLLSQAAYFESSHKEEQREKVVDCVVLDGKERKIVLVETAKEMLQAVRRSEVLEDATVVVLA